MPVRKQSLRLVMTIPYVVLTLALAATVAALSYHAGRQAVSSLSSKLLEDMSRRIGQAIGLHLVGSRVALEAVAPEDGHASSSGRAGLEAFKPLLWTATNLHPDPNNYVYFGGAEGQFIGVYRHQNRTSELRIKHEAGEPRRIFEFTHPDAPARLVSTETSIYDPRRRPWYEAALRARGPAWTPIYIDYKTLELVTTRVKPIFRANGEIAGVLGTDVSLRQLNEFLASLNVSENGVAFVVEPSGHLVAVSDREKAIDSKDNVKQRVLASDSPNRLVREAFAHFGALVASGQKLERIRPGEFDTPGGVVFSAISSVTDDIGLKWYSIVAVPRSDVMGGIGESLERSAIVGVLAALIALAIGLWILNWVTRDLRTLTAAAERIGEGELPAPVNISRSDEIGQLARSFVNMQLSLQTDRLTGIANRDAFVRHLASAMRTWTAGGSKGCIAVLFIDLDRFKAINDRFGHDAGDRVLLEVAARLRGAVRSSDIVARFGGDEFVVLLRDLPDAMAVEPILRKLQDAICVPFAWLSVQGEEIAIGASIGTAVFPGDGDEPDTLIKQADHRMYDRKSAAG